jgi:hypothetical protein
MTVEHVDRPAPGAAPAPDVVHRRWVLSKRIDDGRPLLVREDKVVHPGGFGSRPRRAGVAQAAQAVGGSPART